jgi:adenylosuccinate synthase
MFDTNFVFTPGKMTITLDGGAGSSGKGKLGSFLCEHAENWQFACNTFMPQAAHWVKLDDGRKYLYKSLNSCAYLVDRYEKLYIAPGATISLDELCSEIEKNNVPREKIGISPLTAILQDMDGEFEKGVCDIEGKAIENRDGGYLAKTGTTAKGCGINRARRVLRHKLAKYARDVRELRDLVCDVPKEIMTRLDDGQAGLLEVAQGFQLSYLLPDFYPHTTSRNCTVAAGLDDLMISPIYAGNVILNFRTFPIRICSLKYVDKQSGNHLTMDEVAQRTGVTYESATEETLEAADIQLIVGNSGPGYSDQEETTWDEITRFSGSPKPLFEATTSTRLPRRPFTFSRMNVNHSIRHNRTHGELFLSLNFADYVDHTLSGTRARTIDSEKLQQWLDGNLADQLGRLRFIGTGEKTDDMIQLG